MKAHDLANLLSQQPDNEVFLVCDFRRFIADGIALDNGGYEGNVNGPILIFGKPTFQTKPEHIDAIVNHIKGNPGIVDCQFAYSSEYEADERDAKRAFNWRCIAQEVESDRKVYTYNCEPFEDQLRAYVAENANGDIVSITVCGE